MDPFKRLKLDEILHVMQYLTGKELLEAMKVSQGWKNLIEGQSKLMNRAMYGVVMKPNLKDCSLVMVKKILDECRPYKRMKSPLIIRKVFKLFKEIEPIQHYAASLVILEIDDELYNQDQYSGGNSDYEYECERTNVKGCEFPKLKMLKYRGKFIGRLKSFSFPALSHFQVIGKDERNDHMSFPVEDFLEVVAKMPELKILHGEYDDVNYENDEQEGIEDVSEEEEKEATKLEEIQIKQKIQEISLSYYYPDFMEQFENSLRVLEVDELNLVQVSWVLKDLKVLKSLTVKRIDARGRRKLRENTSIEIFKYTAEHNYRVDWMRYDYPHTKFYKRLLKALPSLKELVLNVDDIEVALVKFAGKIFVKLLSNILINQSLLAASKLTSLKRFICGEIQESANQAYQKVQSNPHRYQNSTFDFYTHYESDDDDNDNEFEEVKMNFDILKTVRTSKKNPGNSPLISKSLKIFKSLNFLCKFLIPRPIK